MSPSGPRTGVLAAVTVGLIAAGAAAEPAAAEPLGATGATTVAPADTAAAPATVPAPAVPAPVAPAAPSTTTTTDPDVAADPSVGDDSGGAGRDVEQARADRARRREAAARAKGRADRREARDRRKAEARKAAAKKRDDVAQRREDAAKEREERARAAAETPGADGSAQDPAASPLGGSPIFGSALPAIPGLFIDRFRIPPFLLPIYQAAGVQYGVPWEILAAINEIETDYGRNLNVSSAGAQGWMQFMPATWRSYGVDADGDGRADPMNPSDAIFAAARYLRAAGVDGDVRRAVFAYNHADWYVDSVLLRARLIGGLPSALIGSLTGLTEAQPPVAGLRAADAAGDGSGSRADGEAATTSGATSTPGSAGADAAAARPSPSDPVWGPRPGDDRAAQITAPAGTPVVAVQDATVVGLGVSETMGRWIRLRDVYGNRYTYAHLGALAATYEVPRSTLRTVPRGTVPAADPAPKGPASAGKQRAVRAAAPAASGTADPGRWSGSTGIAAPAPSPTSGGAQTTAGVATPATALAADAGAAALRLAAPAWAAPTSRALPLPGRPAVTPASFIGPPLPGAPVAARPAAAPAVPTPATAPLPRPSSAGGTVDRVLRVGSRVPGGTVLGTIGRARRGDARTRSSNSEGRPTRSTAGRRATMAFGVRPAGRGAPRVDPRPFLDGWRLLAASSASGADDRRKALFRAGTAQNTPGQVLLLPKARLQASVLHDDRLEIPAAGREQIRAGQIDRRVLATLAYLSASGHRIRVSSLRRPGAITVSGNVSEHDSGNAVDISEVDGQTISPATQGPGSVTDRTIRLLLRLQGTTTPHQIISLMVPSDFGGASNVLAMADHADHLHVGFRVTVGDGAILGRQLASALKPAQWDDLVDRLDAIGNPEVSSTASRFATKVRVHKGR